MSTLFDSALQVWDLLKFTKIVVAVETRITVCGHGPAYSERWA